MTADEEHALRELGRELAGALETPWEPACIAHAFRAPRAGEIVLTMQRWIELEALRSPLLHGELPADADALAETARVFDLATEELEAGEMVDVAQAMRRAVAVAFAMHLPMRPENAAEAEAGFGSWLPTFTDLVVECGMAPVAQAFALLAGLRRLQGWRVAGVSYAQRDVAEGGGDRG